MKSLGIVSKLGIRRFDEKLCAGLLRIVDVDARGSEFRPGAHLSRRWDRAPDHS